MCSSHDSLRSTSKHPLGGVRGPSGGPSAMRRKASGICTAVMIAMAVIVTAGTVTEYAVPTANTNPDGITMGPDGNIWFTERDGNAIGLLAPGRLPPQLSISDATVQELATGGTFIVFRVTLNRPSPETITLAWATAGGTATAPEDYVPFADTLSFSPNQTLATFYVVIKSDGHAGGNRPESFYVNRSAPTNAGIADGQGVGTILQH